MINWWIGCRSMITLVKPFDFRELEARIRNVEAREILTQLLQKKNILYIADLKLGSPKL
jgi:DNA-binding response OmpR family regulator